MTTTKSTLTTYTTPMLRGALASLQQMGMDRARQMEIKAELNRRNRNRRKP